jgi:hypothetical protein
MIHSLWVLKPPSTIFALSRQDFVGRKTQGNDLIDCDPNPGRRGQMKWGSSWGGSGCGLMPPDTTRRSASVNMVITSQVEQFAETSAAGAARALCVLKRYFIVDLLFARRPIGVPDKIIV